MGSRGTALPFLTSAIDGGEWSASCPGRFTFVERAPGSHWIGGWVGPTVGLDAVGSKEKSLTPIGNRIPAVQPPYPVDIYSTYSRQYNGDTKKLRNRIFMYWLH
jgi:hypothetical protein